MLHEYQREAVGFLLDRVFLKRNPGAMLALDMGLGKSLCVLEAISWAKMFGDVAKVLIVAPLRVAYLGWPTEIDKWGFDLTWSILHGPKKDERFFDDVDIHLINHDGVKWLAKKTPRLLDYDLVVIDESTAFKNWVSGRTKAMRKLVKLIPKRILLTGTPAANSYADLFPQMYFVDNGEALGKTLTVFRRMYQHQGGWQGRQWILNNGAEDSIDQAIAPHVLRMSAVDHLDMPDLVINDIPVELPQEVRAEYDRLEEEMFVELEAGTLAATSAGSKYAMCRGFANGGLYENDEFGNRVATHQVHGAKVAAVQEILEGLNGKPAIVLYQFNHDLERLQESFLEPVPTINGNTTPKKTREIIEAWERGSIDLIFAQPMAMSHGVDRLQHAGADVVWMGLPDRNEVYLQANARIYRQGNRSSQVRIHRILTRDTVDEAVRDRLASKNQSQDALLEALNNYRKRRYGCERRA